MMQAGPAPRLCSCYRPRSGPPTHTQHDVSVFETVCLPPSPGFAGPGGQGQGPAEYGHDVLGADHLARRLSEQDGAAGPLPAHLPRHWGGESDPRHRSITQTDSTHSSCQYSLCFMAC